MKRNTIAPTTKHIRSQQADIWAELHKLQEENRRMQMEKLRLDNPKKWERISICEFYRRRNQSERV